MDKKGVLDELQARLERFRAAAAPLYELARVWSAANPPPPEPVAPALPVGATKSVRRQWRQAYAATYAAYREGPRQAYDAGCAAEYERIGLTAAIRQIVAAEQEIREVERAERAAGRAGKITALRWSMAQRPARYNGSAEYILREMEEGIAELTWDPHQSWYPGAAAYVARRLRKAGATRSHTSGRSGARGSIYYDLPGGRTIRISDHRLPQTPEREYHRELYGGAEWAAEIVLEQIIPVNRIDVLIAEALNGEDD